MLAYSQIPWVLRLHNLLLNYAEDVIVAGSNAASVIERTLNMDGSPEYYYSFMIHKSTGAKYVALEIEDVRDGSTLFKIKITKRDEFPYSDKIRMIATTKDTDWFDHLWMTHYIDRDGVRNESTAVPEEDIITEIELRSNKLGNEDIHLPFPLSEEVHFQNSLLHEFKEYEYFKMLEDYCLEFRAHPFCTTFEFDDSSDCNFMETVIISYSKNDEKILDSIENYVYDTLESIFVVLFGEK